MPSNEIPAFSHDLLRTAAVVLTALLIVLGWIITGVQANRREKRKEKWEYLKALNILLEQLKELAVEHHTSQNFNHHTKSKLISMVQGVATRVRYLNLLTRDEEAASIVRLRQVITKNNCDSASSFKAYNSADPRLTYMIKECDHISSRLDNVFFNKYHFGYISRILKR